MKFLFMTYRLPGVNTEQIAALRLAEAAAVWKLVASGSIREIYYSPERPAVIGMIECESLDQARQIMATLPMPSAKLIDFDFFTLEPYSQFALLFRAEFQ